MDKVKKFLLSLNKKERTAFLKVLEDVRFLKIESYDVKPLKGHKDFFRLRKGKMRIVFVKADKAGVVINAAYRKDAYKGL